MFYPGSNKFWNTEFLLNVLFITVEESLLPTANLLGLMSV